LKQSIEKEARIIEDEYERDFRDKLRKEHEIRENEKIVNDLLLLFYSRNI
jgi:hypothetical protein